MFNSFLSDLLLILNDILDETYVSAMQARHTVYHDIDFYGLEEVLPRTITNKQAAYNSDKFRMYRQLREGAIQGSGSESDTAAGFVSHIADELGSEYSWASFLLFWRGGIWGVMSKLATIFVWAYVLRIVLNYVYEKIKGWRRQKKNQLALNVLSLSPPV